MVLPIKINFEVFRGVAQFGSASGLGPEGRRFKSCHPDQSGELSEWFMEPVLKTGDAERHLGFKSLTPRHLYYFERSIKIDRIYLKKIPQQ